VGCGIDGTVRAAPALQAAAALTGALDGARLEVIRVIAPPGRDTDLAVAEHRIARAFEELETAVASLPPGTRAEAVFVQDQPARGLAARSRELDVLLLGSDAGTRWPVEELGDLTARIVREAACPVLLVPYGSDGVARLFH
jgi:nucleotide-binding universal stress UspA family protein